MDAFIAMGGGPGKEGYIDAKKLIKVIKEDFEMTIDIVVGGARRLTLPETDQRHRHRPLRKDRVHGIQESTQLQLNMNTHSSN